MPTQQVSPRRIATSVPMWSISRVLLAGLLSRFSCWRLHLRIASPAGGFTWIASPAGGFTLETDPLCNLLQKGTPLRKKFVKGTLYSKFASLCAYCVVENETRFCVFSFTVWSGNPRHAGFWTTTSHYFGFYIICVFLLICYMVLHSLGLVIFSQLFSNYSAFIFIYIFNLLK